MNGPAQLSDAKRELLERRLRGNQNGPALDAIPSRPVGEDPMSFGQERLWFQHQASPNPSLFNIAFLAHVDGALDADAFEASVNDVIARHEVLRARFSNIGGVPHQAVLPDARLGIIRIDLRDAGAGALDEMRIRADVEARRPFDLAAPPLIRLVLFVTGQTRSTLLFVVHHIVWDGWSSGVFIDEIRQLYEARRAGRKAALPALTTQYPDFAHWQRALMASPVGARQIEYWRERLANLPELISLPTDRPRKARQSHTGGSHEWKIPEGVCRQLRSIARRHNLTQFTILLAAYNVLLMHYSGQRDIAIGTAMACRTRPAFERLTGFFANMVVMRTSLEDDPTFEMLILRTNAMSVEAQAHQDTPFDMLVEHLQPRRSLSHNPLFQIAFVQHHLPIEELRIADLRVNCENLNPGAAAFDLVLHIYGEGAGLKAVFEYDSHLFEPDAISRMALHFNTLLGDLLTTPSRPVSRSQTLDAREIEFAVKQSCSELTLKQGGALLHDMLDVSNPDAIAVVCGASLLTYGELATRSNALAHRLRAVGVGADAPVAILIEHSVELIVAIFGVLKAGGAYLPLDPAYPLQRIQDIVADCAARTAIVTAARADDVALCGVNALLVDDGESVTPQPAPILREDNLAYLIYTSGSTGLSKGVMISHRAAVGSTRAREQFYPEKVKAFLLLSSASFDSSVAGIFWTLSQGGALHIATEAERRDPAALARLIERMGISHLLCLPSLYTALLDVCDSRRFASLRCCIVAGEACHGQLAEQHFRVLPGVHLINEYGPTECAVWSTAHKFSPTDMSGHAPIGRPIPGAQAIVLGVGGIQPQGAAGELCIGGRGLARGYVGRPDLSADRFRPNPFGAPGERLYHSGDRARLNSCDDIEFLGRADDQIKIRGYRVDPREIESVMLRRPGIVECIVVGKASANGGIRLVAYCLPKEDAFNEEDLRRHASANLPTFMVPDCFVTLDDAPRLPNGKVDRNALPDAPMRRGSDTLNESDEASVVEILLADIWQEVLGLSEICGADNFFDLGGNSLAAMQVVARAQRAFGQEIPIAALFESANLHDFAKALEEMLGADFDSEIDAILTQIEAEPVS